MRLSIQKSKNHEFLYIVKDFYSKGKRTTKIIDKLGTVSSLMLQLNLSHDEVISWARQKAKDLTLDETHESNKIILSFSSNSLLPFNDNRAYNCGYLFLQSLLYQMKISNIFRNVSSRHKCQFNLEAIFTDSVYSRVLHPSSKRSSFEFSKTLLEPPKYQLEDVYRSLSVFSKESDYILSELYKNSNFIHKRNVSTLYYDCTNYYFEIEQEDGSKKYGKSKEHRPNPIIQMGLFTDGDGIPLAFSLFPGSSNEQTSLKPLEKKILQEFGHDKFIYCSDAGLGSEANREFNHMGQRAFIVTQSIKKLPAEEKKWALERTGFKRVSDESDAEITSLDDGDKGSLFYKDEPYTTKKLHQRLIITYSPKYAAYQKTIRGKQIERAEKMVSDGKMKKQRKNPNDPARFVGKVAVTEDGEKAGIHYYLDEEKIAEEEKYDGLYAVCTDLLDDPVKDILRVSEGRWQIEDCFRTMKTDFSARPVYVQREDRITAHFLTCFLALLVYRMLEKKLHKKYTCEEILGTLKEMNFAGIEGQGFIPVYKREYITDELHTASGFRTDYEFITKRQMKTIQKKSKCRE